MIRGNALRHFHNRPTFNQAGSGDGGDGVTGLGEGGEIFPGRTIVVHFSAFFNFLCTSLCTLPLVIGVL